MAAERVEYKSERNIIICILYEKLTEEKKRQSNIIRRKRPGAYPLASES